MCIMFRECNDIISVKSSYCAYTDIGVRQCGTIVIYFQSLIQQHICIRDFRSA